jgi:hypothetical protein
MYIIEIGFAYNGVYNKYCSKPEIKIFSCKLKYKNGFETRKILR